MDMNRTEEEIQPTSRLVCTGRKAKSQGVKQSVYVEMWYRNRKLKCLLDSRCDVSVFPERVMSRSEDLVEAIGPLFAAN